MEHECINRVIEALKAAGFAAQRGYPSGLMPSLTEPLAAVSIQSAQANNMTVTVQIYMPVEMGGSGCEDMALMVAQILRGLGAECKVGSCSFSGKSGLFHLPVQATFTQQAAESRPTAIPQPTVKINGVTVSTVVDVSTGFTSTSVKGKDATTGDVQMVSGERRWTVTVEDLLDASLSPQEPVVDGFSVVVCRSGEMETYMGCCWDKITSEVTAAGTRRIRVAITCNEPVVTVL